MFFLFSFFLGKYILLDFIANDSPPLKAEWSITHYELWLTHYELWITRWGTNGRGPKGKTFVGWAFNEIPSIVGTNWLFYLYVIVMQVVYEWEAKDISINMSNMVLGTFFLRFAMKAQRRRRAQREHWTWCSARSSLLLLSFFSRSRHTQTGCLGYR